MNIKEIFFISLFCVTQVDQTLVTLPKNKFNPLCNDEKASIVDCYYYEGVNIANPASYIMGSSHFFPVCELSNMTRLLDCYNKVIDECPDYRDNGPDIITKDTFKAFLIGTCKNKHVYEKGMECIGNREYLINQYNNKFCLAPSVYLDNVWDAYIQMGDWTWEKYCRLMDEGIECSITNAEQFGCPQSLYDFLRYSSYIRLPTECQKPNTTNYKWLQLYTELPTTLNSTAELTADTGTNSSTAINVSFFLVVVGALLNARLY
ncbi:uncharacterized protein LOC143051270 isoform X1 [Mytilus galloprovincialis]|uniref:uncharacterized protein LOC143051270 isoform X1 n=2 Tax=Mytilus galloprovincialis TaxID=29158 RepID=UPI003F7B88FC